MMKLIADSGSTSTRWHMVTDSKDGSTQCHTSGINPFFQDDAAIVRCMEEEFILDKSKVTSIYFYGAGITGESQKNVLKSAINQYFDVSKIVVESDLMAAAQSLCGNKEGIVAILGTGSNSCYYDGETIVQNVSPLGYILGDEGSGAVLGKILVADILKNQFPQRLIKLFFETYKTTKSEILEHVYKKPFPNRYLAQYTRFLLDNCQEEEVQKLITAGFTSFFNRNIRQYSQSHRLPVNFTGSVAWYFSDFLKDAAARNGFRVGQITKNPMDGLLAFHKETD